MMNYYFSVEDFGFESIQDWQDCKSFVESINGNVYTKGTDKQVLSIILAGLGAVPFAVVAPLCELWLDSFTPEGYVSYVQSLVKKKGQETFYVFFYKNAIASNAAWIAVNSNFGPFLPRVLGRDVVIPNLEVEHTLEVFQEIAERATFYSSKDLMVEPFLSATMAVSVDLSKDPIDLISRYLAGSYNLIMKFQYREVYLVDFIPEIWIYENPKETFTKIITGCLGRDYTLKELVAWCYANISFVGNIISDSQRESIKIVPEEKLN